MLKRDFIMIQIEELAKVVLQIIMNATQMRLAILQS